LTGDQLQALRRLSASTGKSTAELIRNGIDQYLAGRRTATAEDRTEKAIRVAGRFSSGLADAGSGHDRHLSEAFKR
jgi:hypothetical protein